MSQHFSTWKEPPEMTTAPSEDLMTQSEARTEAKRLNADPLPSLIAVAGPYPPHSWGGAERGWTVYYVPGPGRNHPR